jgi:hypothetical protein
LYLFDALQKATETGNEDWAAFVRRAVFDNSIDIEGMFFSKGSIFLGFKQPLLNNCAVVLEIRDAKTAFEKGSIPEGLVKIWRKIAINDTDNGVYCGVSDMILENDKLFILTCAEKNTHSLNSGAVWVYDTITGQLSKLQAYEGLRPEGITRNADKHEFFITFDGGNNNPSQFTTLKDVVQ